MYFTARPGIDRCSPNAPKEPIHRGFRLSKNKLSYHLLLPTVKRPVLIAILVQTKTNLTRLPTLNFHKVNVGY